jgi:HD-like signal output (HDOD) protein
MSPSADPALESAQQRIARLEALPVLDPRLPQVLAEPDVNLQYQQLRELLCVDPALAARVLKVANSAFYGSRTISSIDRALTMLGAVAVAGIAMVARFDTTLAPRGRSHPSLLLLRRHSLLTAVAARRLAERVRDGGWDRESAFVLGLLHDLGWLVQLQTDGGPPVQAEGAASAGHALLSAALFAHWQLPAQFIGAARDHHRLSPPAAGALGGALLTVAEHCAVHAGDAFAPQLAASEAQRCLAPFGLGAADLGRLAAECAAEAAAIDGLVH